MCHSLLSMRQDVVFPESSAGLRFTLERMHAAYDAAGDAFDSVASDLPAPMRDGWRSVFELDARSRIHQAIADMDDDASTAAREGAREALATMVVALEGLHDAGIDACDPDQ